MIGYFGDKNLLVNKTSKGNNRRFLIIEAEIETEVFILLSLYNSNSETEQLQALSDGDLLLIDFSLVDTKTLYWKRNPVQTLRNPCEKCEKSFTYTFYLKEKPFFWIYTKTIRLHFYFQFSSRICTQYKCFTLFLHWSFECSSFESKKLRKNFWKFKYSLIHDKRYLLRMKKHIQNIVSSFD